MQATPENRSDLLRETPLTGRALSVQALLLDMPRVPGKCLQEVKDQMYLGLRSTTHDFTTLRSCHLPGIDTTQSMCQSGSSWCGPQSDLLRRYMSDTVLASSIKICFSLNWQPECRLSML